MTTPDSTKTYHANIKKFFEKTAQEKAKETKFVQRTSPINGSVFLLSLVLVVFQHGVIALEQLAKTANTVNPKLGVKWQAFKERFNPFAVEFLKAMFVEALKTTAPKADYLVPMLSSFTAVNVLDSSVINLPEGLKNEFPGYGGVASKAAAKIYLVLNWLTGSYDTIRIEAGRKADQNMGEIFLPGSQPGAFWLFDLGFFKAAFLAAIAAFGSFFLCRLAASQQAFWIRNDKGELVPFDLDLLLRRAPRDLFEIEVVFGPKQEVTARLIIAPVPPKVVAERRRKANKSAHKQGRRLSQTTLNRLDWTLLLTNASPEQLPTSTVMEVYCVRWQVEICQTQPIKIAWCPLRLFHRAVGDLRGGFKRENEMDIDFSSRDDDFFDQALSNGLTLFKREPVEIITKQGAKGLGILNHLLPVNGLLPSAG